MGVSTNFYTVFGIKTEWNDEFAADYDDVYDDDDTPIVLMDSMGGEYIIFGDILFDSGDMRWGFENGDTFKEISIDDLKDIEIAYKNSFIEKFPKFEHLMDAPFKLMTFAHWS